MEGRDAQQGDPDRPERQAHADLPLLNKAEAFGMERRRPGWMGLGQPGLLGGVTKAGVGTRWALRSLPAHSILWFCDR